MKKALKDYKYWILLSIFACIALAIFGGHYGNILQDVGREVYYPMRVLEGKVLYKDLFNIYGPFSYLFNAVLYKIFGAKLSTLYLSGAICAFGIISGVFLVAKRFLSEFLSFSIVFFTIVTGICATHLFNFTFPYSWAMLYGLLGFIYSLLFLLKFSDDKNSRWLYISTFLGGFCVANKYDFLVYSLILFFVILKTRDWKIILKSTLAFLTVPVISFAILFLQGLNFQDLANSADILKAMSQSHTLKYFYTLIGLYFRPVILPYMLVFLLTCAIPFGGLILAEKLHGKHKILSVIIFIVCIIFAYIITNPMEFSYLPLLLTILAICSIKKLITMPSVLIVVTSALTISLKTFWGLTYLTYGNYYMPTILIAFFAVLFLCIKKDYQKSAGIFLIATALCIFTNNLKSLPVYKIKTDVGSIYTYEKTGKSTNELIKYINENTDQTDRIVIFPEGLIVNFLTNRKAEDFYNSMLPMYVEVFTEEKIIEHFQKSMPEYIILNNQSMKDYYYEYICTDYAQSFCSFVNGNYTQKAQINGAINYLIYKRK